MKLPDGNKPIKIGDPSYIYKGVYNPIVWYGNKPYRPRAEMLVIRDNRYVFLRLKPNIEKITTPMKRQFAYDIPGGSLDIDSTTLQQAINETNEEALIDVILAYQTGIQYYQRYEPGFIHKGGDSPLEYFGSISDVCIGVYNGPFDKSKIDPKDLDDGMANDGRFYYIPEVAKYLKKEHITAMLNCPFIRDDIKAAIGKYRMDNINESFDNSSPLIIPDNKLYHGTLCGDIETFKPMSIDLGNIFDTPGWSTFCFDNYESAKMFAAAKAFTWLLKEYANLYKEILDKLGISLNDLTIVYFNNHLLIYKKVVDIFTLDGAVSNITEVESPLDVSELFNTKKTFYVYTIDASNLDVRLGNDSSLNGEYSFRESGIPFIRKDTFVNSIRDFAELIETTNQPPQNILLPQVNDYSNLLTNDYQRNKRLVKKLEEDIDHGKIERGITDLDKYIKEKYPEFTPSGDFQIPEISCDIETPILEGSEIVMEKKYPDDVYGLPKRHAYPMPDEKHVRSAIKFFNYAKSEDEEKELAKNINRKIKHFKIKDIKVGKKNRFKKYFEPIEESLTLKSISEEMQNITSRTTDPNINPSEAYDLYTQQHSLISSFIHKIDIGGFDDVYDEQKKSEMINLCRAVLAETNMNLIEAMSLMENASINKRTIYPYPVTEGTDEDKPKDDDTGTDIDSGETATDYNAEADDAGGDNPLDGDNKKDDASENEDTSTGEEATDYNAEVGEDEGGGDDSDTNDTSSEDDSNTSSDDSTEEGDGNKNPYENKQIKNYFLLNSFLSMHQTIIDVLDSASGIILPNPKMVGLLSKVINNLQNIKVFIEKFIQFQFNEVDYAFNLYYYNILMDALRINLKLFESVIETVKKDSANSKNRRRINEYVDD